jgi:uncharacterized cupin superfamily protein
MKILNINEIPHLELQSASEKFSLSAVLTEHLGFKDVFVHHEIIPPGKRCSSPHCHKHQEEMLIVLSGNPTVHIGKESAELKPGDFVGFKPTTNEFHFVENTTGTEARVLMICSKILNDEILYEEKIEEISR